eukprot:7060330-Prymnesium_polylepis.1
MVPSARPEVARGARARKILRPGGSSKKMARMAAGQDGCRGVSHHLRSLVLPARHRGGARR